MLPGAFQASTTSSAADSAEPLAPFGTIFTLSAKFGTGSPAATSAVRLLSADRRNSRPGPSARAALVRAAAAAVATRARGLRMSTEEPFLSGRTYSTAAWTHEFPHDTG